MIPTTRKSSVTQSKLSPVGLPWLRFCVGLAIGSLFFWLSLRQTSWSEVTAIFNQTQTIWLLLAICTYGFSLTVRVLRWQMLLEQVKKIPFRAIGAALVIGYAMNNILPARLGELFRANFAGVRHQVSRSTIAASIVVERTLDGLIVVASLIFGQLFITSNETLVQLTGASMALFTSVFIALFIISRGGGKRWLKLLPNSISKRVVSFCHGLSGMQTQRLTKAMVMSLLVWLFEGLSHWLVLQALNVSLSWQQMLSVIGVVNLSTLLPSAPGFMGTYQYAYVFILGLFGYLPASGVAAATTVQIFLLGSTTIVGLGLYLYLKLFAEKLR